MKRKVRVPADGAGPRRRTARIRSHGCAVAVAFGGRWDAVGCAGQNIGASGLARRKLAHDRFLQLLAVVDKRLRDAQRAVLREPVGGSTRSGPSTESNISAPIVTTGSTQGHGVNIVPNGTGRRAQGCGDSIAVTVPFFARSKKVTNHPVVNRELTIDELKAALSKEKEKNRLLHIELRCVSAASGPTSAPAPGLAHICAGTRPHLRRDSPCGYCASGSR